MYMLVLKSKNFILQRTSSRKEEPTEYRIIFISHISETEFYPEYIRNSQNPKIKGQITQLKIGRKFE